MAGIAFAVGEVYFDTDTYVALGTGFPFCDLTDDFGTFVSPPIPSTIEELVRWWYRAKKWTVVFSNSIGTKTFTSILADETELLSQGNTWKEDSPGLSDDYYFGLGVVISPTTGAYSAQSDMFNNAGEGGMPSVLNLISASGETLTFQGVDADENVVTAVATVAENWPYSGGGGTDPTYTIYRGGVLFQRDFKVVGAEY